MARKRHGLACTTEYSIWCGMRNRCTNPRNPSYDNYGGRGIRVCDRWLESFEAFLEDMGRRPSRELSLDRINNDGHYEPGNCRWATVKEQANNKRPPVRGRKRTGPRPVKVEADVYRLVKTICALDRMKPTEFLSELLRPILQQQLKASVERLSPSEAS